MRVQPSHHPFRAEGGDNNVIAREMYVKRWRSGHLQYKSAGEAVMREKMDMTCDRVISIAERTIMVGALSYEGWNGITNFVAKA